MERRLNFEGIISHLFLKAKQPTDQIGKKLCSCFIKTVKKMNLLALSGISMESYHDRNHSFNKNTIIFMKKKKKKKISPPVPHLLQAQQVPALPYAKLVGRPAVEATQHHRPTTLTKRHKMWIDDLVNLILFIYLYYVFIAALPCST